MTHHPLAYSDAEIHSLARFQTLQAGQYWRALENVPEEGIDAGMVLLIQSLRVVDDKPHTVVLRPHPLKFGQSVYLEIPKEGGGTRRAWFQYDEHRFLLDDFLARFEFEPDHQKIRNAEVQAVQSRISELQNELVQGQSNPALIAALVHEKTAEKAPEKATPKPVEKAPEPVAAKPAESKEAKPSEKTAAAPNSESDITRAVQSWASAWSRKDVKTYLSSYASDFQTPNGMSRKAWEAERTQRIDKPGKLQVNVEDLKVSLSGDKATVKFRQHYTSATLKSSASKTLVLVRSGNRWLIQQERVS